MRQLVQENIILTANDFDHYISLAMGPGAIIISNEMGKARLERGSFHINDVFQPNMKKDEIIRIISGLINKYKTFSFTPGGYQRLYRHYEFEPDSKTWKIYSKPKFRLS